MKKILLTISVSISCLIFLAVAGNVRSGNERVSKARAAPEVHAFFIPYYSTRGDWDSVLTLNNATHAGLAASVTIYSLDGTALPLPDVFLQPDLPAAFRISDLITHAESRGRFQEGSIELRFTGSSMALGAQLTVSDMQHGLSFDMEPPMTFKSSTLEGLWWSLNNKTRGQVMLCNTGSQTLDVLENIEWQGRIIPAHPISLTPHQTIVLDIDDLLKQVNIKSKGIQRGGLSISHNGAPGALIAHGMIQNSGTHFSSNLNFIDPAAHPSSMLNGTGLLLGRPASIAVSPLQVFSFHISF